jgi:hypothetical protein
MADRTGPIGFNPRSTARPIVMATLESEPPEEDEPKLLVVWTPDYRRNR